MLRFICCVPAAYGSSRGREAGRWDPDDRILEVYCCDMGGCCKRSCPILVVCSWMSDMVLAPVVRLVGRVPWVVTTMHLLCMGRVSSFWSHLRIRF